MSARGSILVVRGGEEITWPIALVGDDGTPYDFTGQTIAAEIHWEDCQQISLAEDDGIEIVDLAPPAPAYGELADPQFEVTLDETQTESLPMGRVAWMKIILTDADDKTTLFGPITMDRIL